MKAKIMIIGAGNVGATIAYAISIQGIAREIIMVDLNQEKLEGEVLDLNHGRAFIKPVEIQAGTYADCAEMDIIIITAGAKQNPGESRIDLIDRNLKIMKHIIADILVHVQENQPVLLIVSNPCDILTYAAWKYSGFPSHKIIGSGTALDSSRLRFEIANQCTIDAHNVHGYIVGEHGDSELALWSSLRIGNTLFKDYCKECSTNCANGNQQKRIEDKVRNAAYVLIEKKGYTNFAIGLATSKIVEIILRDHNTILPVSTPLHDQYGLNNVALSLPCIINRQGIRKIIKVEMNTEEKQRFLKSARKLQKIIQKFEL